MQANVENNNKSNETQAKGILFLRNLYLLIIIGFVTYNTISAIQGKDIGYNETLNYLYCFIGSVVVMLTSWYMNKKVVKTLSITNNEPQSVGQ